MRKNQRAAKKMRRRKEKKGIEIIEIMKKKNINEMAIEASIG